MIIKSFKTSKVLLLVAAMASIAVPASANLVVNGNFLSPSAAAPPGYIVNYSGITGWSLDASKYIAPSVYYINCNDASNPCRPNVQLQDGVAGATLVLPGGVQTQIESLASYGANAIYQDIPTTSGQAYTLSFYFSPRPQTCCAGVKSGGDLVMNATLNHINVFEGNPGSLAVIGDYALDGSQLTETSWHFYSINFTATGPTSRIEFFDAGTPGGYGPYITAVSVDPSGVPEPATWALMLGGAVALLLFRKRTAAV